jgi:hypothetical protein
MNNLPKFKIRRVAQICTQDESAPEDIFINEERFFTEEK